MVPSMNGNSCAYDAAQPYYRVVGRCHDHMGLAEFVGRAEGDMTHRSNANIEIWQITPKRRPSMAKRGKATLEVLENSS